MPLCEVLERLDVADKSLLVVRILNEVIAHELLLGRLHDLIQICATLSDIRIETANISLENFLIGAHAAMVWWMAVMILLLSCIVVRIT